MPCSVDNARIKTIQTATKRESKWKGTIDYLNHVLEQSFEIDHSPYTEKSWTTCEPMRKNNEDNINVRAWCCPSFSHTRPIATPQIEQTFVPASNSSCRPRELNILLQSTTSAIKDNLRLDIDRAKTCTQFQQRVDLSPEGSPSSDIPHCSARNGSTSKMPNSTAYSASYKEIPAPNDEQLRVESDQKNVRIGNFGARETNFTIINPKDQAIKLFLEASGTMSTSKMGEKASKISLQLSTQSSKSLAGISEDTENTATLNLHSTPRINPKQSERRATELEQRPSNSMNENQAFFEWIERRFPTLGTNAELDESEVPCIADLACNHEITRRIVKLQQTTNSHLEAMNLLNKLRDSELSQYGNNDDNTSYVDFDCESNIAIFHKISNSAHVVANDLQKVKTFTNSRENPPGKRRPEKTDIIARRMIGNVLGVSFEKKLDKRSLEIESKMRAKKNWKK